MKFEIVHRFDAPVESVWEVMTHPRLCEVLVPNMPSLLEMEILEQGGEGDNARRKVRYRPVPMIKKVGPKKVEPHWMEWVEHSTSRSLRVEFRNVPRVAQIASLMENSGVVELFAEGGRCRRVLKGELRIKVPILGRIAERIIHKNAVGLVDEEAEATRRVLAAGGVEAFLAG
jgi:hypothetical protein